MTEKLDTIAEMDLVARLIKDDMAAFDQLFWLYQKAVYMNVLKLTKDSGVAEDIVQEVFSTLWQKRASLDQERSIGGWLFISSYNRAINALKKKSREAVLLQEAAKELAEDDTQDDLTDIQLSILEKAISLLSPQRKRVFELCKLQGYTYEQAAQEMGISKHTVKEYLAAAILQIKNHAQQDADKLAAITLIVLLQHS
ncbi:MAG: sigma-70 family RNA polymerase sigma factor [Chitinophagales bacterium]|nr:sigma-70 family RNA polymerase sigma factor [Chitinophagales bacterium]